MNIPQMAKYPTMAVSAFSLETAPDMVPQAGIEPATFRLGGAKFSRPKTLTPRALSRRHCGKSSQTFDRAARVVAGLAFPFPTGLKARV